MSSGTSAVSASGLAFLSVLIALFSLGASVLQNVNYLRSIDSMQRNILRTESLKTCRDIIEVFFRFRLRAEFANMAAPSQTSRAEMKALAYQFGALGTFQANFQGEPGRQRYAALSWHLNAISEKAGLVPADEFDKLFVEADRQFTAINDDCVKAATGHLL